MIEPRMYVKKCFSDLVVKYGSIFGKDKTMINKQINIVEILAEQCKNCTLYEGDTISLTISIFDRPLRGVCFDNNIYFSVDELNYIMQKLISKEQECEELKQFLSKEPLAIQALQMGYSDYKERSEVFFEMIGKYKQTLAEIKEIAEKIDDSGGCAYGDYDCDNCSSLEQETVCTYKVKKIILQKISEVEDEK